MKSVAETRTLDQAELAQRQAELRSLERDLTDRELSLSTLKSEIRVFEEAYRRRVGSRHVELDQIKARVLEMAARLDPESSTLREQAESAREQARQSEADFEFDWQSPPEAPEGAPEFTPSDELKKLFREAAKKFHPDLSTDSGEQDRRHHWMARLNDAYLEQDLDRIRDLIEEWDAGQAPKDSESVRRKLMRVLRQTGQVRHRLNQLQKEYEWAAQSDMARLRNFAEKARVEEGRDVLQEMAEEANEKITTLKNRIATLASDCTLL